MVTGERLAEKVAIVTGGAGGLGTAVVRRFCAEGASVLATDVVEDRGRSLADDLHAEGFRAAFARLDVTDEGAWQATVEGCIGTFGSAPNVLVNVAGIAQTTAIAEETLADWSRVIDVNLTGVFLGMRAVIPHMRAAGGGSIVNVSSTWAETGFEGFAAYHASKGGVTSLTRNAAVTYAGDGIRVNAVSPGNIVTPMSAQGAGGAGLLDRILALTPLARGADPNEIASALVYLASDEASYVTGATFAVDGGYTAQ
jgi:NAD(P)-dependent dehydrogenase (short-subunit alcohol dehydrogenase family)